jgi:hypothetical protein
MAINYLNNVDFNRNELQNAQLIKSQVENQPNDAAVGGTPVEGQLYFNTTSDVLKIYGNGSWSEVGGGVETLTTTDGTYIDLTPNSATAGAVTVTADLSAIDGTSVAATRFLSKDNTWDVPAFPASDNYDYWVLDADGAGATAQIGSGDTADFVGGLKIGTNSTAGGTLNITHDLQTQTDSTSAASPAAGATFTVVDSVTRDTTGHATGLNVKTITLPAAITVGDGQINGATSGLGISGSMSATANQSGDTTFTVASNASIGPTVSTLMHRDTSGYGYVVTPASGDSSTKIATTAFVQAAVTGLLEFKGGFNATSGELDDGSGNDLYTDVVIAVGDYYVVTTAGNFFGNTATPLTVGDSVIVQTAKTAGNAAEADFIVVQSDTDLATASTVGLGNVAPGGAIDVSYSSGTATVSVEDSTASNKGAVIVAAATDDEMLGIDVAYASGTAEVGLAISAMTTVATTVNASLIPIFDEDDGANRKISVGDLFAAGNAKTSKTGAIAAGSLSGTVAHTFGQNTLVQTFDAGSGATVFCDVARGITSPFTITATISATQTNAITILVQKIG